MKNPLPALLVALELLVGTSCSQPASPQGANPAAPPAAAPAAGDGAQQPSAPAPGGDAAAAPASGPTGTDNGAAPGASSTNTPAAPPATSDQANANPPADPNAANAPPSTPSTVAPAPVVPSIPPIEIAYAVGKQWVYSYDFGQTGTPATTMSVAIKALDASGVTWEIQRQSSNGESASQTIIYPKDGLTPFSFMGVTSATNGMQVTSANEKVTVPAGTFDTVKTTITQAVDTPSGKLSTKIERWVAKDVGLIKQVTTTTNPAATASAPPVTSAISLVLQSYK